MREGSGFRAGELRFTNCKIERNRADYRAGNSYGGFCIDYVDTASVLNMTGNTIADNVAADGEYGAGYINPYSESVEYLSGNTIRGNHAYGLGGNTGGIYLYVESESRADVTGNTFVSNTASQADGAISVYITDDSLVTIADNEITSNSAMLGASAISIDAPSAGTQSHASRRLLRIASLIFGSSAVDRKCGGGRGCPYGFRRLRHPLTPATGGAYEVSRAPEALGTPLAEARLGRNRAL